MYKWIVIFRKNVNNIWMGFSCKNCELGVVKDLEGWGYVCLSNVLSLILWKIFDIYENVY